MANITSFEITKINKDSVEFKYNYKKNTYDNDDGKREETVSWSFSMSTGESSTETPCKYTPGGDGVTKYTLTATLNFSYAITTYELKYNSTEENQERDEKKQDGWVGDYWYEYTLLSEKDGKYYYDIDIYKLTSETTYGSDADSKELTFYPHPAEFAFKDCISGKQWKVEDGIKSLITNITDFQGQAQQRKNWKHQLEANFTEYSACPSFFDNNIITRKQMNAVYQYVNENKVDVFPEKDANNNPIYHQISAAMFNDLATIIND